MEASNGTCRQIPWQVDSHHLKGALHFRHLYQNIKQVKKSVKKESISKYRTSNLSAINLSLTTKQL
jgi:hypothetical protein